MPRDEGGVIGLGGGVMGWAGVIGRWNGHGGCGEGGHEGGGFREC